jgi:hypothetical protein
MRFALIGGVGRNVVSYASCGKMTQPLNAQRFAKRHCYRIPLLFFATGYPPRHAGASYKLQPETPRGHYLKKFTGWQGEFWGSYNYAGKIRAVKKYSKKYSKMQTLSNLIFFKEHRSPFKILIIFKILFFKQVPRLSFLW